MTEWTGPITKLQALNVCLSSMGEPEVATVDAGGLDAQMADRLLDETSATVQAKGWSWNREVHKLSPDINGFIYLPANVITADTTAYHASIDAVQRGLRLFNKKDNTYVFATFLTVDMLVLLPWDDLNFNMRLFVTASAAMILQQRLLGSAEVDKALKARTADAWNELMRDETRTGDYNMLRDSWTNASVLNRGMFSRGSSL